MPAPTITVPWLVKQFDRQGGRCAITGVTLRGSGPEGATIDRIEPGQLYTRNNVQIVTNRANPGSVDDLSKIVR